MKRETAIEKVAKTFEGSGHIATNEAISTAADILQRECDLREGLIEMSKILLSSVIGFQNQSSTWKSGLDRWKAEYEALKKL